MPRSIDPASLLGKLDALERVIEAARAIAPYRCELAALCDQDQAGRIQNLLLRAEREAASMRLRLSETTTPTG